MKKIITGGALIASFMFSVCQAVASTFSASCTVNGKSVPCDQFPWWIFVVVFVVLIVSLIFWIKMIVKAVKSSRTGWAVVIFITGILGAIVYYFAVKGEASSAVVKLKEN